MPKRARQEVVWAETSKRAIAVGPPANDAPARPSAFQSPVPPPAVVPHPHPPHCAFSHTHWRLVLGASAPFFFFLLFPDAYLTGCTGDRGRGGFGDEKTPIASAPSLLLPLLRPPSPPAFRRVNRYGPPASPPHRLDPAPSSRAHSISSSSCPLVSFLIWLIDPWWVGCVVAGHRRRVGLGDGVVGGRAGVQGPALRAAGSDAPEAVEGAHRRQHGVPLLLEPGDQGHAVRAPRRRRAVLPIAAAWLLQARGEAEEQRTFRGNNNKACSEMWLRTRSMSARWAFFFSRLENKIFSAFS